MDWLIQIHKNGCISRKYIWKFFALVKKEIGNFVGFSNSFSFSFIDREIKDGHSEIRQIKFFYVTCVTKKSWIRCYRYHQLLPKNSWMWFMTNFTTIKLSLKPWKTQRSFIKVQNWLLIMLNLLRDLCSSLMRTLILMYFTLRTML